MRQNFSSGAPWEQKVAYRRAVQIGNVIEVSGTTAMKDGELIGIDDPYLQAFTCLEIIENAIKALGGQMADIIRTRMYVTNIKHWEEIGKAHHAFFKDCPPATTMVEVAGLIDARMLVEIEASAIISN